MDRVGANPLTCCRKGNVGYSEAHVPSFKRISQKEMPAGRSRGLVKEPRAAVFAESLSLGAALVPGAEPLEDIRAVGPVLMAAVSAAEMVDALAGKALRRKTRVPDDNLAVFIHRPRRGGRRGRLDADLAKHEGIFSSGECGSASAIPEVELCRRAYRRQRGRSAFSARVRLLMPATAAIDRVLRAFGRMLRE